MKAIFAKARPLIPSSEEAKLSWLDEAAAGDLADNYLTNKSDDAPLPETLPGIKLKRPWASLIKKYEMMTGKKVEVAYNPRYNPRPERQTGSTFQTASVAKEIIPIWLNPWLWIISGGMTVVVAMTVKIKRRAKEVLKAN